MSLLNHLRLSIYLRRLPFNLMTLLRYLSVDPYRFPSNKYFERIALFLSPLASDVQLHGGGMLSCVCMTTTYAVVLARLVYLVA